MIAIYLALTAAFFTVAAIGLSDQSRQGKRFLASLLLGACGWLALILYSFG